MKRQQPDQKTGERNRRRDADHKVEYRFNPQKQIADSKRQASAHDRPHERGNEHGPDDYRRAALDQPERRDARCEEDFKPVTQAPDFGRCENLRVNFGFRPRLNAEPGLKPPEAISVSRSDIFRSIRRSSIPQAGNP